MFVQDGWGFVWDADAAMWLQHEHRVLGAPVGGMASNKQQNLQHGLPVMFSPEEATVLLELGAVELRASPAPPVASAADAVAGPKEQGSYEGWEGGIHPHVVEDGVEVPTGDFRVEIPAAEAAVRGGRPSTSGPAVWGFPGTPAEAHRLLVFRDLHRRGYYMVTGIKFGGDFLVYEEDPSRAHSAFVVTVLPLGAPILPQTLVAHARSTHAALKHLLIASVREAEGREPEVVYVTVAPAFGFSNTKFVEQVTKDMRAKAAAGGGGGEDEQDDGDEIIVAVAGSDSEGD